jgi:hypothetical protein
VQRGLVLGAAWTASAAAAVGLGFLAVSLVGASASPGPVASTSDATPTTTPTSGGVAPSGETATAGGTVFASCDGAVATLASAPAPGWWVDDSSDQGEVEFRNGTLKVEIRAVCVDGGPQFTVEGPRADDSGGSGPGTSQAPAPASSSADDHGGHGGDDGPGDDSSGRGGGGHGSDD